jgi:hypothetical protein
VARLASLIKSIWLFMGQDVLEPKASGRQVEGSGRQVEGSGRQWKAGGRQWKAGGKQVAGRWKAGGRQWKASGWPYPLFGRDFFLENFEKVF